MQAPSAEAAFGTYSVLFTNNFGTALSDDALLCPCAFTASMDRLTLATNTADSDGLWNYIDPDTANFPSRYYRSAVP